MNVNQMLHQRTREELETLKEFWIPDAPAFKSTASLVSALSQRMTDPSRVLGSYKKLFPKEREILRALLRTNGHTDTVSAILGRSGFSRERKTATRMLFALEWKGFISLFSPNASRSGIRSEVTIPLEIARALLRYVALEGRPLKAVLSLRDYLEVMEATSWASVGPHPPIDEASRQASAGNPSLDFERLTTFSSIEDRINAVEDDQLRKAIYLALRQYCGLLSLSRLNAELRSAVADKKYEWQTALETQLLGTISEISLLDHRITVDGEHLIIFQEVVDAYLRNVPVSEDKFERTDSAGLDFITDMSTVISFAANNETRLTQMGVLYKSAAKKIQALTVQRANAVVDESGLLDMKVVACFKQGLLTADADNRIEVTDKAFRWEKLDLVSKLKRVFNAFNLCQKGGEGRGANPLKNVALDVMRTLEVNRWYPRLSISHLSLCRHLLGLADDAHTGTRLNRAYRNTSVFRLFGMSPEGMCADLSHHISPVMASLGMLDLGIRGGVVSAIRLTEIGAWILGLSEPKEDFEFPRGREGAGAPKEKLLIVNPDFEVLLFPGERYLALSYQLSRFCRRAKSDQLAHFRITKEGIETAALNGITPEMVLSLLEANSRNPIPQNVEYSIRDWGGRIRIAVSSTVQLLETQDAEAMEKALSLGEIQDIFVRRLSPTAIVVSEEPRGQEFLDALRDAGIYLR